MSAFDDGPINCTIEGTMFGIEDHGFMTYVIRVGGEGWGQGAGTIVLGPPMDVAAYFKDLLETIGVYEWERLPGKNIRIKRENGMISEIGHIFKNKWFSVLPGTKEGE